MHTDLKTAVLICVSAVLGFAAPAELLPFENQITDIRYQRLIHGASGHSFVHYPVTAGWSSKWDENQWLDEWFSTGQTEGILLGAIPAAVVSEDSNLDLRSWLQFSFAPNLSLVNSMRLDHSLRDEPGYIGKKWRGFAGYTEQSYLDYWHRWQSRSVAVRMTLGRFFDWWGPGRTGQLLMSSNPRPLDQVRLILENPRFSVVLKTGRLDNMDGIPRYFAANHISVMFGRLQLGLGQAAVYGGEDRNLEWAYLNPLIIYYGEQDNGPELVSNPLGSLDGSYRFDRGLVYWEILIDDIQFDNQEKADLEPDEIGFLLGYDLALENLYLGLEGAALTNRTYKTARDYEWMVHRHTPIGYADGSDLWRLNCTGRYYYRNRIQLDLELDYLVRGEGEMNQPWDQPWIDDETITMETGYSENFPTGITENSFSVHTGIRYLIAGNKWAELSAVHTRIKNYNHINGREHTDTELKLKLFWELTMTL